MGDIMSSLIGDVVGKRSIGSSSTVLSLWGISSSKLGSLHFQKVTKRVPTSRGVGFVEFTVKIATELV
jgi:hypothetical protein